MSRAAVARGCARRVRRAPRRAAPVRSGALSRASTDARAGGSRAQWLLLALLGCALAAMLTSVLARPGLLLPPRTAAALLTSRDKLSGRLHAASASAASAGGTWFSLASARARAAQGVASRAGAAAAQRLGGSDGGEALSSAVASLGAACAAAFDVFSRAPKPARADTIEEHAAAEENAAEDEPHERPAEPTHASRTSASWLHTSAYELINAALGNAPA